jgi:hypothetical protein
MRVSQARQDEIVTCGAVALGNADRIDAIGRIIAHTADARVRCRLLRCNGSRYGTIATVDQQQLLTRMDKPSWRRVVCAWS